jgi:hypothetical protein
MPTQQFTLNNSAGDVLEVDTDKKEIRYFRDPWARDSSNLPEKIISFAQFTDPNEFAVFVRQNMYPADYEKLMQAIEGSSHQS